MDLRCELCIFTNAVPYNKPEFVNALQLFDQCLIKLDASDEKTYDLIARPRTAVNLDELATAMGEVDGVIIQTMIVTGLVDNRASVVSPRFARLVKLARATEVQLYTIDKRPAYDGVHPVTEQELHYLATELQRIVETAKVVVFYQDCPSGFPDVRAPTAEMKHVLQGQREA